jgi:hypothetical protein
MIALLFIFACFCILLKGVWGGALPTLMLVLFGVLVTAFGLFAVLGFVDSAVVGVFK